MIFLSLSSSPDVVSASTLIKRARCRTVVPWYRVWYYAHHVDILVPCESGFFLLLRVLETITLIAHLLGAFR